MLFPYQFSVRDTTVAGSGVDNRKTGIVFGGLGAIPGIVAFKSLATTGNINPTGTITIGEFGFGRYNVTYDIQAGGPAWLQLDAGVSIPSTKDRYVDISLDWTQVNMLQPVPTGNKIQNVGDALNGARAQAFGPFQYLGTAYTMFDPSGTTPINNLTLDSATAPTRRF